LLDVSSLICPGSTHTHIHTIYCLVFPTTKRVAQCFGNWICFRHQVYKCGERPTRLDPNKHLSSITGQPKIFVITPDVLKLVLPTLYSTHIPATYVIYITVLYEVWNVQETWLPTVWIICVAHRCVRDGCFKMRFSGTWL
jgi:hypothetical protein